MAKTFSLTGWEKYQHYGKRESVPWVKLHRDTLTSLAWIKGDDRARMIMVGSMALAARYQNAIPIDWDLLKSGLALKCTETQLMDALRYLEASGFIATCEQSASKPLEQEEKRRVEEEKKPPIPPAGDEDTDAEFSIFCMAYPSRGRDPNPMKPARAAWYAAIARGAVPAELIRLAPTAAAPEKHGTSFVPTMAKWLAEDRWKDPVPTAPTVPSVDPHALWRTRLTTWAASPKPPEQRFWLHDWGPKPPAANPLIPSALYREFNLDGLEIPGFLQRTA
jgi:hypothetical protein